MTLQRISLHTPLRRGERRVRIALLGLPGAGTSTLFEAVRSTAPQHGTLNGDRPYQTCTVQIGLDEAQVVDLPSVESLHHLYDGDLGVLQYLLWGNAPPPVTAHESATVPAQLEHPDCIIQVIDATNLARHLELTLELSHMGVPVILAVNRMDEVRHKGQWLNLAALGQALGMPVVPVVATHGQGIAELFRTALESARQGICPLPQSSSSHLARALQSLSVALHDPAFYQGFRVPHPLLVMLFAGEHAFFERELQQHFAERLPALHAVRAQAAQALPRALPEEIHADRHHRAALLEEMVHRAVPTHSGPGWQQRVDSFLLHPRWGLVGCLAVFAAVLFVVFEVSGWIDAQTTQRLATLASAWQPESTTGVLTRAVVDALVGLVGIVVPYMLPLVLLLIVMEESGLMHRVAFVVDRAFHHIGLHGGVAVPFLLGLGCNVPAISAVARMSRGREQMIASLLLSFVPCSARSAIILAIAGRYLGVAGVVGIYALTLLLIAVLGRLLARSGHADAGPGQLQEIPPYRWPKASMLTLETWDRTRDILTIVTPLLVVGSVLLALLSHLGADQAVNWALTPITHWWLGLPVALGIPLLFGVLRKELSLLMLYQALGTQDVAQALTTTQIVSLLLFLNFYVPCVSTFAVMLKTLGRRQAAFSLALSVGVALVLALLGRVLGTTLGW